MMYFIRSIVTVTAVCAGVTATTPQQVAAQATQPPRGIVKITGLRTEHIAQVYRTVKGQR